MPFGNLLQDGNLDEIYNSTYARIVKLSSLNRSYCLCNLHSKCVRYKTITNLVSTDKKWEIGIVPEKILVNFDPTCNLFCRSCRVEKYEMDDQTKQETTIVVTKLLNSGWLEKTKILQLAGNGELFYSPFYRQLLFSDLKRQQIRIQSNGTLFNEENWKLVADKYKMIDVSISVDAATKETYTKLRCGGNWHNLMKNLTMLSDLHRQKQIREFQLSFVVQRDNFREMSAFVKLGKKLGVDIVLFQRLNRYGNGRCTNEFLEQCLIIDNQYLDYELWSVLQDPIFKDSIVDLGQLQRYIDGSEKRYRKRYEREQKQI